MRIFLIYQHAGPEHRIANLVSHLVRESNPQIEIMRPAITQSPDWASEVSRAIRSSDAVVAFVFNAPQASVMLELGLAMGAGKPILLCAADGRVPTDLAGFPIVICDENVPTAAKQVVSALGRMTLGASDRLDFSQSERALLNKIQESPDLIDQLSPVEYERVVGLALNAYAAQVTRPHHLADYALIASDGRRVIIECKAGASGQRISMSDLSRLEEALVRSRSDEAILVTESPMTTSARAMADVSKISVTSLSTLVQRRPVSLRRSGSDLAAVNVPPSVAHGLRLTSRPRGIAIDGRELSASVEPLIGAVWLYADDDVLSDEVHAAARLLQLHLRRDAVNLALVESLVLLLAEFLASKGMPGSAESELWRRLAWFRSTSSGSNREYLELLDQLLEAEFEDARARAHATNLAVASIKKPGVSWKSAVSSELVAAVLSALVGFVASAFVAADD